jgi:hypothetical protein
LGLVANVIKLFTAVITSLSAQLSQNHREIRRQWRNYGRKKCIILATDVGRGPPIAEDLGPRPFCQLGISSTYQKGSQDKELSLLEDGSFI